MRRRITRSPRETVADALPHGKKPLHVCLGRGRAQAYPDRTRREIERDAHGIEDMGGAHLARRTRRARGHGNAGEIERNHGRLGAHALESEGRGVGQPGGGCAEHRHTRRNKHEVALKPVPQARNPRLIGKLFNRFPRCGTKSGDGRRVFRAGARPRLLSPAGDQRRNAQPGASDDGTNAARTADLVAGQRENVAAQGLDGHRQPARNLDRIHVQHATGGMNDRGGFGDRLDHAGLVVGGHDGHQGRPLDLSEHPLQRGQVDDTVEIHRDRFHGARTEAAASHDGRMLHCGNEQPGEAEWPPGDLHVRRKRGLVGLGTAAGKGHAGTVGAAERRDR